MENESFDVKCKRVLREHKHSIVRSALRGHKNKGRGLVLVKCVQAGKSEMVHLSYQTLDTLKNLWTSTGSDERGFGAMIVEKVSNYLPGSQISVVVTDGKSEHFSLGVRHAV
jgi:hypothetical protein